jgi:hypothetical protein
LIRKTSAERERERLNAGIDEVDRECSIDNRLWLADQLVEALFAYRTVAPLVDVETVSGAWWLPVDGHAERHCARRVNVYIRDQCYSMEQTLRIQ